MKTDENVFGTPPPGLAPSATSDTLCDSLGESFVIDYEDHYQVLRNATVMMVDDEPTTTEILQAFLEDEGYRHFVTTNQSPQAMTLVQDKNPDVVLLDLNMPDVTGFDILRAMRQHSLFRHIPVIVLTSSDDSETKLQALQLGATDFLAKPVDPSELALRLRNTLAAKAYQDRLTYYDALTGLPNRKMFLDRLIWSLRQATREGSYGAVLHIDLDRFKEINDTLGHSMGDTLLQQVAQRLLQCVRDVDTVGVLEGNNSQTSLSRLGGDEFTVLLPDMARVENAAQVARRLLKILEEPFHAESQEVFVTPSIGIAVFPGDGEDVDTLLKHADVAMYHAKQRGRNTYAFYSQEMNTKSLERLNLENQLRKALDRNELFLVYQPKVDIRTGRISGTETLLRWHHPESGSISPQKFIPLAEETGLIVPFGEWILHTACRQNKAWQTAGLGLLHIAINVSIRQFHDPGFVQMVQEVLNSSGLDPQYLTLELTENMIMENARENIDTLHQIKAMGVKLSMDDFGTGYSSLSYLTQFPLDELKIDRSFIRPIQSEADDAPIVTAIIAMAHSLGLSVVAEGVETEPQLAFLKTRCCDEFQGFLFSKPLPEANMTALMTHAQPNTHAIVIPR